MVGKAIVDMKLLLSLLLIITSVLVMMSPLSCNAQQNETAPCGCTVGDPTVPDPSLSHNTNNGYDPKHPAPVRQNQLAYGPPSAGREGSISYRDLMKEEPAYKGGGGPYNGRG